jgi:hypothetical protein
VFFSLTCCGALRATKHGYRVVSPATRNQEGGQTIGVIAPAAQHACMTVSHMTPGLHRLTATRVIRRPARRLLLAGGRHDGRHVAMLGRCRRRANLARLQRASEMKAPVEGLRERVHWMFDPPSVLIRQDPAQAWSGQSGWYGDAFVDIGPTYIHLSRAICPCSTICKCYCSNTP